jgi:hypothetical protein
MKTVFKNPVLYAFILCFFYWAYLFFTTRMNIEYDAIGYEHLGSLLHKEHWSAYFKGLNREPLYPLLISFSMRLGELLSVHYQWVQRAVQTLILFLTQVLMLGILRKLKVRESVTALTILYAGVSPALVNSALSLYSEIATYPVVLLIILASYRAWQALFRPARGPKIWLGGALGLVFVAMTLLKGIFEVIAPVYFVFYFFLIISCVFLKKEKHLLRDAFIFLLTCLIVFYSGIFFYKSINKKYNGHFAVTTRGAWALYGNTARRMEKLDFKRLATALAYVPGEGVCDALFGEEPCRFWSFETSDDFGLRQREDLTKQNLPPEKIDKALIGLSVKKAMQNPLQYCLLMGLEGMKLVFWESTKIGFVAYPPLLMKLFYFTPFKDGLRLSVALLTLGALFYATRHAQRDDGYPGMLVMFILILIVPYIITHAFFFVLTRYVLPIAPLYLILIAFGAEGVLSRKQINGLMKS